ncbi:hypothetical protein DPMN_010720 [Dreissena polymorpha]|uniref:Uncharacterized protein n=1 Tax=Dreissena polymorpha TaxID=45954 RepID=A0A9D4N4Q6_DREPO|nr:hypothetical protein DPMN_010720 [Dreissena polymorpha]
MSTKKAGEGTSTIAFILGFGNVNKGRLRHPPPQPSPSLDSAMSTKAGEGTSTTAFTLGFSNVNQGR